MLSATDRQTIKTFMSEYGVFLYDFGSREWTDDSPVNEIESILHEGCHLVVARLSLQRRQWTNLASLSCEGPWENVAPQREIETLAAEKVCLRTFEMKSRTCEIIINRAILGNWNTTTEFRKIRAQVESLSQETQAHNHADTMLSFIWECGLFDIFSTIISGHRQ